MLVDFGRAVDLECAKSLGVSQSDAQLVGDANCGRMKCVAMRRGLPWSYDVDTLGICASAYALLYAEHMELLQQSNGRWKPKDPHSKRRLGFTALWTYIFDKLLNVDAVSKIALDSRPSSLYTLQKQVVTLLDDRVAELKDALRKQMQLLRRVAPELRGDRKT
jgi:checkpoint serine/threonine-protein kinase